MFVVIWEFDVKPGCEADFEGAYGPDGDWVALFRPDPHYRETRLVRDVTPPHRYLTLDRWDTEAAYDAFQGLHAERYARIDTACARLTDSERLVGRFSDPSR